MSKQQAGILGGLAAAAVLVCGCLGIFVCLAILPAAPETTESPIPSSPTWEPTEEQLLPNDTPIQPTFTATQALPRPTPRPAVRYMFCNGCGDPRRTEPLDLCDGKADFRWDQGGTGVFGIRLENVATEESRIVVGPIEGHMAGWETTNVAAGSYRLWIWCWATDFCVYVEQ